MLKFSAADKAKLISVRTDIESGFQSVRDVPGLKGMEFRRVGDGADAFYMSTTTVSSLLWYQTMNRFWHRRPEFPMRPKVNVSILDIWEFTGKFNSQSENLKIMLPSETEWWEAFGDQAEKMSGEIDSYAWFCENSASRPRPSCQKRPNFGGFYDMAGNVWEWTHTKGKCYSWSYVALGGSWRSVRETILSCNRRVYLQDVSDDRTGFRLVIMPVG